MGNTVQPNGRRVFNDVISDPQDSQDLADDIFASWNVRVGTSAERQALPVALQRAGMLWVETDTGAIYRNVDAAGTWRNVLGGEVVPLTNFAANWTPTTGYAPFLVVEGRKRSIFGAVTRGAGGSLTALLTVPVEHRATVNYFLGAGVTSGVAPYQLRLAPTGVIDVPYGGGSATGAYPLTGSWWV